MRCFESEHLFYVKIPKCASTSVREAMNARGVKNARVRSVADKRLFTVIRNPYSRLLSAWSNRVCGHGWRNSFGKPELNEHAEKVGIRRGMPFRDLVEIICGLSDEEAEWHFKSMRFVLNDVGRWPDFFLRLERLGEQWPMVAGKYGLSSHIRIQKRSDHGDWRRYYDDELMEMVYRRYADDFRLFGYGAA